MMDALQIPKGYNFTALSLPLLLWHAWAWPRLMLTALGHLMAAFHSSTNG